MMICKAVFCARPSRCINNAVYQQCAVFNKLSPFHAKLEQVLKADALRPKPQRCTAKALLAQIRADGYDDGYSQLTDFIRTSHG